MRYRAGELALDFVSPGGRKIPGLFDNVKARFKEAIGHYVGNQRTLIGLLSILKTITRVKE